MAPRASTEAIVVRVNIPRVPISIGVSVPNNTLSCPKKSIACESRHDHDHEHALIAAQSIHVFVRTSTRTQATTIESQPPGESLNKVFGVLARVGVRVRQNLPGTSTHTKTRPPKETARRTTTQASKRASKRPSPRKNEGWREGGTQWCSSASRQGHILCTRRSIRRQDRPANRGGAPPSCIPTNIVTTPCVRQ